ncbi:MAG: DinB family protein [Candidatus Levybacteria bacterium]|nr:DinB family protein [Candidatus Levybacteria bacterium]
MNAVDLLKLQFKNAHETLEGTMNDVGPEVAHVRELGKALPVGAAYSHAVCSEDILLSKFVAQKDTIMKDPESIGLSELMPGFDEWDKHAMWAQNVTVDLEKFRKYAKEVYAATDSYLETLKDEDLDADIEMGQFGKHKLGFVLSAFFLLHIANLTGEISAAKGLQGLKGYPF